jgi:hypothetical protein
MVRVLEDASAVAADVAMGKMHAAVARKAVEVVAMEVCHGGPACDTSAIKNR